MSELEDLRKEVVELTKKLQIETLERYVHELSWNLADDFFTEAQWQELRAIQWKLNDHIKDFS